MKHKNSAMRKVSFLHFRYLHKGNSHRNPRPQDYRNGCSSQSSTQWWQRGAFIGSLALCLGISAGLSPAAHAEGSKELTSNGGNRAFLLYHSGTARDTIGSIALRTTIKVYVNAGETINLGSSANGIGSGRINYRSPTGATGSCLTTVGRILNRTQEVAGPAPNTNGYTPCIITTAQTTTAGSGIWEIDFVSPNPANDVNPTAIAAGSNWTQANNVGWIAAWDVTVRNSTNTGLPFLGRVYSNSLALRMPNTGNDFTPLLYVQTADGYRYQLNPRRLSPFTFVFFANNNGFKSSTTNTPLFRSVLFPGGTGLEPGVTVHDPNTADSGINVTHKIFFNTPSSDLPFSAPSASGSTWLLTSPVAPQPSNFTFQGVEGTAGTAGTSPLTGNFSFTSNVTGRFLITLDLNQNGIYGDGNDKVLSGFATPGTNTLPWDGRDGAGATVPASSVAYGGQIVLYAGEIHLPLLDAESNPSGITIQRLNDPVPPTVPNPNPYTIYFDDTTVGGSSALNGVDSSTGVHGWNNPFGDNKGIDTWAYYPSGIAQLNGGVVLRQADLEVVSKTHSPASLSVGSTVTYTIVVRNNGPTDVTNAAFTDTVPAAITGVNWSCTVSPVATGNACGAASGSGNTINTTVNLKSGATATYVITGTVSSAGTITNTAKIVRTDDVTDPDDLNRTGAGNNSKTDTTTVSLPTVNLSGTVFEDVNYGGGVGRDYTTANNSAAASGFATGVIRRPNVRVELYSSAGNFLTSTLTDTNGAYSFTNQPGNTSYTVRVVNGTVTSARPSSGGTLIPVQTYRTDATTGTITAVADRVGGENPTLVDAGNGSTTLAALTTATTAAQSIAQINAGAGNITGIDFGFNFDTIVSTRDSGQGSLRQFIINSNTLNNTSLAQVGVLSGREESIFMISDGAAHPGLRAGLPNQFSGGVATITLATALPAIANATSTNANRTSIDGRTQTALTGDTNAPIFNNTTGPEIVLNVAAGPGLEVQASFTFIKNIGITGANGVGTAGVGVYFNGAGAANSRLEDATIFSNDNSGVKFQSATSAYVNSNIIRNNGVTDPLADGVELIGSSSNNVTENIIINNPGYGIDLHTTTNNSNNLSSNQIINNGAPDDTQDAGIGIRLGSNNLIGQNTIANNLGDGIVVAAGTGNTMTENSIYSNGGLGIDLGGGSEGNGVTLNDSGDLDTGANGLFNFPILESAQLSGGNLVVKGFARPGSKIEFFVKQPDPSGFGEGQEYLVTLVEDSADDADATTDTYTSPFNGLNQGTDTTNRFEFSIPLGSLPNTVTTADTLTATATCLNSENCTSAPNGSTSEFSGNITITGSPHLSLVKRITAINGVPFSGFDGTATDPNNNGDLDEDVNWGLPLDDSLRGRIDGGFVQPGEEVEYTIYYLSTGATTAQNVLFCDRVPANMSFLATGFDSYPVQASGGLQGVARGILWQYNGTTESLTNVSDGDTAMYFPPGVEPSSVYPSVNCQGSNTTGAIVVNLGDLINATAPGIPANAYGFVRFKAKLN
ncbi:hypothetical protein C7B80_25960 [Cyanosarcina cf. burmensis CCALA 770]|nr:hypothetical protein C7B80_25960 [Cyanosarcina cf. burmensis CCALA 770]